LELKSNRQPGFILPLLIAILVVLGAGAVVLSYYHNRQEYNASVA